MADNIKIGSPADDLRLERAGDLVEWLESAAVDCSLLAENLRSFSDQQYLRGRAHAFGLAAAIVRDYEFRFDALREME